jgi:preprotein translocase subunit SecG
MLRVILTIVQVFASFAIIGLVLLQRGKGADAGAGFGAGASGTVFGARGAATALSRATAIFAAIFMVNSLLLTYVGTRAVAAPPKSILDTISEKTDKGAPNANGAATPGAAPGAATTPGTTQPTPAPTESPAPTATPPATDGGDATATTPAPAATPVPAATPAAPPATAPAQPSQPK